MIKKRKIGKCKIALVVSAIIVLVAGVLILTHRQSNVFNRSNGNTDLSKIKRPSAPLQPLLDAYNKGRYKDAEAEAQRFINKYSNSKDVKKCKQALSARYLMAFSAARRKDMKLARNRFASLKLEAARPKYKDDKDADPLMKDNTDITIEEDAAYQHAVCTGALGDKKAAEAEYIKFMQTYPESPLIHGAIKRIQVLNNGHLPDEANAVWEKASKIATAKQQEREKIIQFKKSLCGPECLSELLRRNGKDVDIKTLARNMKTSQMGTSMLALSKEAGKYGLKAKGLALTPKGLKKQPTPLITLIRPGHYVILDKVTAKEVTIWDPSGKGLDKPSTRSLPIKAWEQMWSGAALAIEAKN